MKTEKNENQSLSDSEGYGWVLHQWRKEVFEY